MFCSWCRKYDGNEHRNQFVRGCSSMKLESIKRHEASQQHADAKAAHLAQSLPEQAPMEMALLTMEQAELDQMRYLFNTAYYLIQAEHPFRDFSGILTLQRLNSVSLGNAYSNEMQAKVFVSFIAEDLRAQLVQLIDKSDFFSISIDSSTDKGNIDEEIVQVRPIENYRPVYKFVAVKPLVKPDAVNTVSAIVSALEDDCELSAGDWQSKLIGMSADGAAVNFGSWSGVVKRVRDSVPHLISVHCCAHRIELAIKSVSKDVPLFKVLEDTLIELYKLYKWPP